MGTSALSNLSMLSLQRTYSRTRASQAESIERVSSGLRVNRAEDDPAGLGYATNLETTHGSLKQAMRNINDALSLIDTAEGATSEVEEILNRLRENAVYAASETITNQERAYIQLEVGELLEEIDRIGSQTQLSGFNMLAATQDVSVLVGATAQTGNLVDLHFEEVSVNALGLTGLSLASSTGAQSAIDVIDSAVDTLNDSRLTYGATQNRLTGALDNLTMYYNLNLESAESSIRDADLAREASRMARYDTMAQAGVASLLQAKGLSSSLIGLL